MLTVLAEFAGSMKKLTTIEACRGIAALIVVAFHAVLVTPQVDPLAPHLFLFGGAGVDFFFALSGFIIGFVHWCDIGRPERVADYARKRLVRIYPVYWVVMAIMIAALRVVPSLSRPEKQNPLFEIQSLMLWPQSQSPILGVSWSLSYEMAFYILFAILIVNRTAGAAVMAMWALLIVGEAPFRPSFPVGWLAEPRVLEFFAGIATAFATRRWPARSYRGFAIAGGLAFLGLGMIESYVGKWRNPWWPCLYGLASTFLIYGLASGELTGKIKRVHPWLILLGAASYSIYLTHYPILILLGGLLRKTPPNLAYWSSIPMAAGVGIAFHLTVERRITRALRPRAVVS